MSSSACTSRWVSAVVGSSMMTSRASSASARAMATSCLSATGSDSTRASSGMSTSMRSQRGFGQRPHAAPVDQLAAGADFRAEGDVLGDRQVGKEREVLKDDLDAARHRAARIEMGEAVPVDDEPAGGGALHPGENLDQGRLAAAVLAGQADDLARLDGEAHLAQRLDAGIRLGNAVELDERGGRHRSDSGLAGGTSGRRTCRRAIECDQD